MTVRVRGLHYRHRVLRRYHSDASTHRMAEVEQVGGRAHGRRRLVAAAMVRDG